MQTPQSPVRVRTVRWDVSGFLWSRHGKPALLRSTLGAVVDAPNDAEDRHRRPGRRRQDHRLQMADVGRVSGQRPDHR